MESVHSGLVSSDVRRTLFDKLWQRHVVCELAGGATLLYVDRQLIYEVTSPQAFEGLRIAGRKVRRSATHLATADHNVPTAAVPRSALRIVSDPMARAQVEQLNLNCADFGITNFDLSDPRQGIIHVVGPEQGATLPGMLVVAGDSHTSTHGAFAALALGIGTSEVEHVLATQCLALNKPRAMRVLICGQLGRGVGAKDLALQIITQIGNGGASGFAIEFAGDTVRAMSMEARMTLCNMAIEAGARLGLIAVDETTLEYLHGRPFAPSGDQWTQAVRYWKTLRSDQDAAFDSIVEIDASSVRPMVSWGTSPDMAVPVDGVVPDPAEQANPQLRASWQRALDYMGLQAGTPVGSIRPDKVFIGSCTNSRIDDLRVAAAVLKGRHIAASIQLALVVPGSGLVKAQAEAEGLDQVFKDAGFEWREPGCSMCLGMNDDRLLSGERCASTSNRNFEGRQGRGGRSHLVSPAMAAAAAVAGHFVDVSRRDS